MTADADHVRPPWAAALSLVIALIVRLAATAFRMADATAALARHSRRALGRARKGLQRRQHRIRHSASRRAARLTVRLRRTLSAVSPRRLR